MASAFARFPMFRLLILLVTAFLVPPPLFTNHSTPSLLAEASIDDLREIYKSEPNITSKISLCIEEHKDELAYCLLFRSPFYGLVGALFNESQLFSDPGLWSGDQKVDCCGILVVGKCFSKVAKKYCSKNTRKAIFLGIDIKRQDWQCEEYVSWQECANPLTLILLVVVPIALIIAIALCVCCCCRACGRANHPGKVIDYRPQNTPVLA